MANTMRHINIIGHQNPDTDSICSALAYAWLKNRGSLTGLYEARRAGHVNRETKFVLLHFGVEPPRLCTDVSPQIKDIDIRKQAGIDGEMSLRAAWNLMRAVEIDTLCIVDDERQVLLQSLLQNKAGLGHAALGCIDQQQNAVDHLQNALDLAAEVRVARGVDDVDLNAVVLAGAVLGQNRDAALTLDVAGVHDALGHLLVGTESAGLLQHLVDQGGLAVVDVRNDCNVAEIFLNHIRSLSN